MTIGESIGPKGMATVGISSQDRGTATDTAIGTDQGTSFLKATDSHRHTMPNKHPIRDDMSTSSPKAKDSHRHSHWRSHKPGQESPVRGSIWRLQGPRSRARGVPGSSVRVRGLRPARGSVMALVRAPVRSPVSRSRPDPGPELWSRALDRGPVRGPVWGSLVRARSMAWSGVQSEARSGTQS
jgi:hypothetical protein